MDDQTQDLIKLLMEDSEKKAWKSLAGYKLWMFGYNAAKWVNYNKLLDKPLPNPFRELIRLASKQLKVKPETAIRA